MVSYHTDKGVVKGLPEGADAGIALCRKLLGMAPAELAAAPPADYRDRFEALTGQSLRECPHCHTGIMVVVDCITRSKLCMLIPDTS
jgi:hypothetical protein